MFFRRFRALAGPLVCAAFVAGCSSNGSQSAPLPVVPCDSTAIPALTQTVALADVGVYVDASDPSIDPVRADLASYLGTMWGGPVTVATTAPDGSKPVSIWVSSSAAAAKALGATITTGYALQRIDAGSATTLLVYAPDAPDLAAGAYALLETLGARFFHPKQELVPSLGTPRIPATLAVQRKPAAARRGLQVHTLHPIEYFDVFMQPSDANLADAKRFIDWLVKTGQNFLQWPLLSSIDWKTWEPYALQIMQYAHSRNVTIGASVEMWSGAALQNNYDLVTDTTQWQTQIAAGLDQLLQLPWDLVELCIGEFVATNPDDIVLWLNYATDYILQKNPSILVNMENHVGNYPQLWVPYEGETVFYYQLGQFDDARLGQNVHTLSIFDLYRDWATYAHPNFFLQHDYILKEIPTRRVSYFPESAYWISADIDVPLFLPETIYARWLDIHTLTAELASKGLPPLDGHVMFSSGHEWNYWLTDYLTAKMLWSPGDPLDSFFDDYAAAYGSCADDVSSALATFTNLQTQYLFDQKLFAYVQGENSTVDEGYLVGLETHPKRVEFQDVVAMNATDRASFQASVVEPLEAFASQVQPVEDTVSARCRGSDATLAPWCNELWDGIEIVRLRAQHAALLYRAVLQYANHQDGTSYVTQAQSVSATAAQVIARREAGYRFDLTRETGQYSNPTIYPFGYLYQTHTECYWTRREGQVTVLLKTGAPAGARDVPSCD